MKALLLVPVLFLCGCASANPIDYIIPCPVPPLTDAIGYDVPDFHGITTIGLLRSDVRIEKTKLALYDQLSAMTITATENVVGEVGKWMGIIGLGGGAGLYQVGLRKKRPQDFTEDEYQEALRSDPQVAT